MSNSLTTIKDTKEITSLEQMSSWLTSLQEEANLSVQEAIKAQLQVIRFIQSPNLVDTTLDTFLLHLKKSLRATSSEFEREQLREQFALMIQNFVFFMDARLQYVKNENSKEAQQLLMQAGDVLANCVKELALMAIAPVAEEGSKVVKAGMKITKEMVLKVAVHNIFENKEEKDNFFSKVWKWITKRIVIKNKEREFYYTLNMLFLKLGKYHKLIGKSMLINDMIERYNPEICEYVYEDVKHRFDKSEIFPYLGWGSLIGMIISLLVGFIRWIVKLIAHTNVDGWFGIQMYWTLGIIGIVIGGYVLVELTRMCYGYVKYSMMKKRLTKIAELFEEGL